MLLQTILQLNILILATPALAGWSLLPPVHGAVRVACIVWQYRAAETPVPRTAVAAVKTQPAKSLIPLPSPPAPRATVLTAAPRVVLVSLSVLPHAARAP